MKTILITDELQEATINDFKALPDIKILYQSFQETTPEQRQEINGLIGFPNPDMVAALPKLDWVQLTSAGANNFGWLPEHIVLANAYGAYGKGISEYMIAACMMVQKDLPQYLAQQQEHNWKKNQSVSMMAGAKVLSVGMGSIGTDFLKRAHALGASCYGVRRSIHDKPDFVEELYTMDSLDQILPEFDIVALSLPETEETIHMFDYNRLMKMKASAILINVGRGSAIISDDLVHVLKEGHLLGAILDVTEPEPLPQNHALWNAPRVYITPHISGGYSSPANYTNVVSVIKENLIRYSRGEDPIHIVDRKIGY